MRKTTYKAMKQSLENALNDLAILAGEKIGPSNVSWQDVAGTAAVNLRVLASQLDEARKGNCEAAIVFPSPAECLEAEETIYEVVVGNIGTVYSGSDIEDAKSTFNVYVEQSKSGIGRAKNESVYLMIDGECEREYLRPIADAE